MKEYRKFRINEDATLRVAASKIVATVSSKKNNTVLLYVEGVANPFHLPITDTMTAHNIIDYTWERNQEEKDEDE